MKKLMLLSIFCSLATVAMAANGVPDGDGWHDYTTVFKVKNFRDAFGKKHTALHVDHRIPAITTTTQGNIVVVSDDRYGGHGHDMGWAYNANKKEPVYGPNIGNKAFMRLNVRYSPDGGNTWHDSKIKEPINPDFGSTAERDPRNGITDPAIVHDPESGKTFLFGYYSDRVINGKAGADTSPNSKFYVYTSDDGGKTWGDPVEMKKDVLPPEYNIILQGPGGGMTYKGAVFVPIQVWSRKTTGNYSAATAGFLYTTDHGKTWKRSNLIENELIRIRKKDGSIEVRDLSEVNEKGLNEGESRDQRNGGDIIFKTTGSESNIFHHKGKIYMAVRAETGNEDKKRLVYSSDDFGQTWKRVQEDFIPADVSGCETSTLALSEDVYIVGYARKKGSDRGQWGRKGIYLTTNTGKTMQVFFEEGHGYSSLAKDEDNLYAFFEGSNISGDLLFRRFDISAKDYANVNAQIYKRGKYYNDVQTKLLDNNSLTTVEFSPEGEISASAILPVEDLFKFGAFHDRKQKNSDEVYRTIDYTSENTVLTLAKDGLLLKDDNLFVGVDHSKIKYVNETKNTVDSIIAGYGFNHELNTYDLGYKFQVNGAKSTNHIERNKNEGLGKSAEFNSYTLSLKNEVNKSFPVEKDVKSKFALGVNTTLFAHDEIKEKNGNNFNDALVKESKNISNEVYANVDLSRDIKVVDSFGMKLGVNLGYKKELSNVDEWRDKYTILDVEKDFATPVEKEKNGIGSAKIYSTIKLTNALEGTVSVGVDSKGSKLSSGKISYKF